MIDIKKGRNSFEKFPTLQEKCDNTVILAQRQQQQPTTNSLNTYTSVHKPKTTTTRSTTATVFTTTTKTRPHTTTNAISVNGRAETKLHNGVGRRAASVGSTRNTKISNNARSNNNNNNSKPHSSDDTNPVRAANKPFFLVPQFQDQNFLKEECELAHAQVAPKQQQQQQKVVTANGDGGKISANNTNNNNTRTNQQASGNHRRNSGDSSKSNNNTSNSNNHSQKTNNNAYAIINSIHASISSRRTATATTTAPATATVAAVTANGVRRSGGGSANASVNINQHHHHHHVSTTASAVATTSTNGSAANAASGSAKNATTDTTVHKVDIVFNNRAPTQTSCGGRFVTSSKSAKSTQPHSTYNVTRPLTGTTTTTGAPTTSSTATFGGGVNAAATATKLSNGQSKLVRPLVHRTIPSTAVAAANAAAARENVNAYSNKLFNSYGSNSNRLSNNNNNNINNNGVHTVCHINNSSSSNNNITSNNTNGGSGANGMQHTLDHDDIKYIDSDDAPTTAAIAAAHASATTVTTPSRGGAQLERKTQLRCEQLCCPHTNCATSTTATLTGAAAGGGGGGGGVGVASASLKTRMRPKSTIICSTSNLVFEKINNYKYANGSAGGGSSAAKFAAEAAAARRNELRHSIDSNSIRASIEKFDSFSEQKRGAQVTLRSHGGGSGSTNNLQHHRHSGSEFDHATGSSSLLRLAQSGGGSLTRAPYRTVSPAPATACKVTATMHAPTLTTGSTGVSASSIRSGACSTNSLPTKSLGSVLAATTNTTTVTAINRHQEATALRATERASPSALLHKDAASTPSSSSSSPLLKQAEMKLPNGDVKKCTNAETNGVCDGAAADVETIRSTALRSIPPAPPSPTASRYRDRDSRLTSSSVLSSSLSNNIDDASKSKDENAEGLCGLRNIGNTCFMNSVIQCLSHTSELTKFLRTHNGIRSTSSKDQQILQEFAKLIREMWTSNVHSVTPMDLKRAFSSKHRMYSDYNQQDAQEFLRFFLDSLHSALNSGVKGEHLKIDDNLSDNKKADLTWEWYTRHENSLIRDLFVGQLKSTLRCTTCGNTSVTFDPFWDLSVSLPSSSRCKLESCLDLFIREEVLDGDEMPTCAKCRQRRRCTKSFTIQRFPKYLVIHLKRFSETRWSKLSNIVEFPTGERELNMGPYGSNPGTSIYYSLYAISNHMGSTAGGHYVALCKHPVSRKWHEFNDNVVSDTLSENNLVSSSAYILFYERA
ncbi:ubiquitin carboxyl-terminal hydrolase Usp2 isoform X1 [Bactrocera dorsalis]|uniref:ubiquitinyl hydrolase 1 n=1 Tax=Bactrocera dorsalis TaxID=27457 RepID=A0A8N4L2S5_BACDO|nr:ubiquitin carboxyl-terminal hydrolase Usp2 isoform X1 [Bactrocera dorsalis]